MRHTRPALPCLLLALLLAGLQLPLMHGDPQTDFHAPVVLPDAEVDRALVAAGREREAATTQAPAPDAAYSGAGELAAALERCWQLGATSTAEAILDRQTAHALRWDDPRAGLAQECVFHYGPQVPQGTLEIGLQRGGAGAPVVIAIPPGTYATQARSEFEDGSSRAQDLVLLRGAAVTFEAGQRQASVILPIACGKFDAAGPTEGLRYRLARFPEGSREERLLVHLCAGDAPPEAAAQLAVWFVRNGMTQEDLAAFVPRHPVATFHSGQPIRPRDVQDAAQVILGAGLDPRTLPFFGGKAKPGPNDRS